MLRAMTRPDVGRGGTYRKNRRLKNRLVKAKLRHDACLEDIDYWQRRGMGKSLVMALASCRWIAEHHNLLIRGPIGVGKSFLACVLSHKACLGGASRFPTRGCQPSCAQWSRPEGTAAIKR
ncbi:hypothetical protein DFAR_3840001 [Desulfarculales bacterium]